MEITVALAGDTMLGRGVAERLAEVPPAALVAPDLVEVAREADLFVLNLECCISERGLPWPDPGKPFFFRAPPAAVDVLAHLGVDAVTLANNHALDFGEDALLDTLAFLDGAGIAAVGAGPDADRARRPIRLAAGEFRMAVVGASDHPSQFAAGPGRPGIAFADLRSGVPSWVRSAIGEAAEGADATLLTVHWGPNMVTDPVPHVRRAAEELSRTPATLVAGHSAHVFHGVSGPVLFDLGDFLDDYAVDPVRRNDLGLLWLATLDERGPRRLEAVPLRLEYCRTRLAEGPDAAWVRRRFLDACTGMGTEAAEEGDRLVIRWR
ncbi:MAG TPA: CapA family protein [Actinomycetota bacterium]|nr:CapA family protein [Actinomycetota bacterium]